MCNSKVYLVLFCLLFSAVSYAAPPAPVQQTGQTTCWDSAGTVINCVGTGQDGERKAGVAWPVPRFTDNSNGTMTDNLTGLIWLKNLTCLSNVNRTWSAALSTVNSLQSGQCGLTDNSVAGQWRLPNKNEMESLMNSEHYNSGLWLLTQGFTSAPQGGNWWTSSTHANVTSHAWIFSLADGEVWEYGNKNSGLGTVAVR